MNRCLVAVTLALLACVSLGSVRLDGLGPNLVDIIDDPVTDLLRYPQLNVLTPGWLVGAEKGRSYGTPFYHTYARITGRWSVAAALTATRGDTMYDLSPSLALASRSGDFAIGLALTTYSVGNWAKPPQWVSKDTTAGWEGSSVGNWRVSVGTRWDGPGFTVDGNVSVVASQKLVVDPYDYRVTRELTPSLRVSWPGEHLSWRTMVVYDHRQEVVFGYHWFHPPDASRYGTLTLIAGPTIKTGNLIACAGLRAEVNRQIGYWGGGFYLPIGIEWQPGPLVLRLGDEIDVGMAQWQPHAAFSEDIRVGIGLRPVRQLRLDFVPDLDNAANLRGWELAAALDF